MESDYALQLGDYTNRIAGVRPFGISHEDRFRHIHLIGQTGTGKSNLLKNLIAQDIASGEGFAVLDPHGDLAAWTLDHIPPERADDVVYFNPADYKHCPGINLLEPVPAEERARVASNVMGTFRHIWADVWGHGRMQYIFLNTLIALLDYPNTREGVSLLGVPRMYADTQYRAKIVSHIKNPTARAFWTEEFPAMNPRFQSEALSPIQNKVGQFFLADVMRNIVGQSRSTINFAKVADERRIFIANLDKGRLGEDVSNLLGSLVVTGFQLGTFARSEIPEEDRVPFHMHIDEFQSFATNSFGLILSEARKFALSLTCAHQYLGQLQEEVYDALMGNAGTLVSFRVGGNDAQILTRQLEGVSAEALTGLSTGRVIARILNQGYTAVRFGETSLAQPARYGGAAGFAAYSRSRFTRPRHEVERRIVDWYRQVR